MRDKRQYHGMTKTVEFRTWSHMIQRCINPNDNSYKHYGAKGIKICDRWKLFINFYEDMGDRPSNKHSLDRIDSTKHYSPENCRWATTLEQGSNTSRNLKVSISGETMNLAEAVRRSGISRETVKSRLSRGMSFDEALTKPSRGIAQTLRGKMIEFRGVGKTASQWAIEIGIEMKTLLYRLKSGWSIERTLTTPVRKWPIKSHESVSESVADNLIIL